MKNTKYSLLAKVYNRNILSMLLLTVGVVYIFYSRYKLYILEPSIVTTSLAFEGFSFSQSSAITVLILFLFISFEYISKVKRTSFLELSKSIKDGKANTYIGMVKKLFSILLAVTLLFVIIDSAIYFYFITFSFESYMVILNLDFINIFLVGAVAILAGTTFGIFFNRYFGYAAIIFTAILSTTLISNLFLETLSMNPELYKIPNFFSIQPYNTTWAQNALRWSLESQRFNIMFFWIAFFGLIILITQYKKITKNIVPLVLSGVLLIVGGYNLYTYIDSSRIIDNDSSAIDFNYIQIAIDVFEDFEEPEFSVEKYTIDLDIRNGLEAVCSMEINDDKNLESYKFTLSYSYGISKVYDQDGNNLEYTRESNYIEIINPTGTALEEINMIYSGNNTEYRADNLIIALPDYFAFIPFEGYIKLNDRLTQTRCMVTKTVESEFDVSIKSNVEFATNLEYQDGRYTGQGVGFSVFGGSFVKVEDNEIKSIFEDIYIGEVEDIDAKLQELYDFLDVSYEDRVDITDKLYIPTYAFTTPNGALASSAVIYDDHIIVWNYVSSGDVDVVSTAAALSILDGGYSEKHYDLRDMFYADYFLDINGNFMTKYKDIEEAIANEYNEYVIRNYELGHALYNLIIECGEREAVQMVYNFIKSDSDEDSLVFMERMLVEYGD